MKELVQFMAAEFINDVPANINHNHNQPFPPFSPARKIWRARMKDMARLNERYKK